ncbi:hypothetical protein SJAV_12200 [Sulfurisphaera javensis]|uniref:Piwi domain-containing protein n=1 Tax=Sulfurisphaera javensis TaxID=2049879 RepID=A0AAT9GQU5_9CREN
MMTSQTDYVTQLNEATIKVILGRNAKHHIPEFITVLKPYKKADISIRVLALGNISEEYKNIVAKLLDGLYNRGKDPISGSPYQWPYLNSRGSNLSKVFNIKYEFDQNLEVVNLDEIKKDISNFFDYTDKRYTVHLVVGEEKSFNQFHDILKVYAKIEGVRLQFIKLSTLRKIFHKMYKYAIPLNLAIQFLAKSGDGTPWIPDQEVYKEISKEYGISNGLVIGISFARPHEKIVYGVGFFSTFNNYYQKFELEEFELEESLNTSEGLYVPKDKMADLLEKGLRWYREVVHSDPPLVIIYKTSPLHKEEKEAIKDVLGNTRWVFIHAQYTTSERLFDTSKEDFYVERGTVWVQRRNKWKPESDDFYHSKVTIAATGYIKPVILGKVPYIPPLGTPKPIRLNIFTNIDINPEAVAKVTLLQIKADWEHLNIKSRKIAVLKYSNRFARLLQCALKNGIDGFRKADIRDIL